MSNYDFKNIIQSVVDGESEDAVELVEEALKQGVSPYQIIDLGLVEGMKIVSDKYDRKQYFVPDLAASAEAMSEALELIKPLMEVEKEKSKGTIVIGVVQECSQEIGKNIVAAMLSGAGFKVYDLGINVSPRQFVDKAKEVDADIIGMGSPMLQTVKYFTQTEQLLRQEGLRDRIKLLVGGAATNESTPKATGTDAWAADGNEAVKVSQELL